MCFLIYMNDMEEDISSTSKVSKFDDDTKLSHLVSSNEDIKTMQEDIDKLQDWAQVADEIHRWEVWRYAYWLLQPYSHLRHGQHTTERNRRRKDLGIWIHKSLKTSTQCAAAVKKANIVLGMIKRNFV